MLALETVEISLNIMDMQYYEYLFIMWEKINQSSKFLPENLCNIVDPVIEQNGFFAHLEHLMLAMRKHIRELGRQ